MLKTKAYNSYLRVKNLLENHGCILITAFENYSGSKDKLDIVCPQGHHYSTRPTSISTKTYSCKQCATNSQRTDINEIKEIIKKEGYTLISDTYNNNNDFLSVKCSNDHEYKTTWSYFKNGNARCPICYKERINYSIVKETFLKEGYELLTNEYIDNKQLLNYKCSRGHINNTRWYSFNRGNRCPDCFLENHSSRGEREVLSVVQNTLKGEEILNNTKNIISPKEIDIFIPTKKIAIEYNGLYWHSVRENIKADFDKFKACREKGIRYIGIFEDEWKNRENFIREYLKSVLGVNKPKFSLRPKDISIKKALPTETKQLLDKNHYAGGRPASFHYGIYYSDRLIGCVLLSKPTRQTSKYDYEIVRMCMDPDYRVYGIWSYFKKRILDNEFKGKSIVSFSDNRRDTGKVYEYMGFIKDGEIPPDYYWCDGKNRYHKSGLRKTKEERLSGLTEVQLRESQGFFKVYDVGKTRWVLFIKNP